MKPQLLLCVSLGLVVSVFDATAITLLPQPWSSVKLLPSVLLLFSLFARPWQAYTCAFSAGIALDLFAFESMSFSAARFILITAGMLWLIQRFLTHRSLYTVVALVCFFHISNWVVSTLTYQAFHIVHASTELLPRWQEEWKEFVVTLIFISIVFIVYTKFFGALLYSQRTKRRRGSLSTL